MAAIKQVTEIDRYSEFIVTCLEKARLHHTELNSGILEKLQEALKLIEKAQIEIKVSGASEEFLEALSEQTRKIRKVIPKRKPNKSNYIFNPMTGKNERIRSKNDTRRNNKKSTDRGQRVRPN